MDEESQETPIASWESGAGQWLDANGTNGDLFGRSEPFSGRWPTSGTMLGGHAYPLPELEHHTAGTGFSSPPGPVLKTPTKQLADNGGRQDPAKRKAGGHGPTLDDEITYFLPTPGAGDWKGSGATQGRARDGKPRTPGDMDLPEAIALLPTLAARDSGSTPRSFLARKGKGRKTVTSLAIIAENGLIPTGGRMSPPSAGGKPSSAGPPPAQLTLDGMGGTSSA